VLTKKVVKSNKAVQRQNRGDRRATQREPGCLTGDSDSANAAGNNQESTFGENDQGQNSIGGGKIFRGK